MNGHARHRWPQLVVGVAGCVGLVVSGVLAWPRLRVGDVDPASLVVGLASLAAAVWPIWQARRQEQDVGSAADRLARTVAVVERRERGHLLGGDDLAVDVDVRITPARSGPVAARRLSDVAEHVRSLPAGRRRLVITGAPGAGKTVLALHVMLELLTGRAPGDPVPVRLPLAAWPPETGFEGWLVGHLRDNYGLNAATAEALVAARLVLPVLDGLDEMDGDTRPGYQSRSARAVRALDEYRTGTGKGDVVLTCRTDTYRALQKLRTGPRDTARAEIAPLAPDQVREFVERRAADPDRWAPVLRELDAHPHGTLATGLSTPWRLTAAVTVYEQRDPADGRFVADPGDLLATARRGPAAIRRRLNEGYVTARAAGGPYPVEQVRGCLAVLAGHLARDAGTNIVLHELWPLAGRGGPRAIAFGLSWIWPVAAFVLAMVLPRHLVGPLATSVTVPLVCLECYLIRQKLDRDRPSRRHIDLRRLGTARGRLLFGWRFCAGMVVGFLFMLAVEAVTAAVTGRWPSLQLPIGTGLVLGLAIATVVGLGVDSDSLAVRPRDLLRNDVLSAVVGLLPATVACAVIVGTQGSTLFSYDLHRGALLGTLLLAVPAGVGFVFALGLGVQALRYLSFLLCCRRWNRVHLPFRLGHFLGWCHHVGLLRVSGVAYQFRHRELQDHLVRSAA